ncbi:unnamed protein product [Urochloa humidicola]
MSAPPPAQAPPLAVDDFYDDDGFDWEAAVREIDEACARAKASTSASAPPPATAHHPLPPRAPGPSATAPLHRPPAASGGAARQSTLDRFVGSSAKRMQDKEGPSPSPAPATAARVGPGVGGVGRPGEGCSRQAEEKAVEDRFMESFTRRQREKERAAPAAAAAPAGGRKRAAPRAKKGCPRY